MTNSPFPSFPRWLSFALVGGAAFLLATVPFLLTTMGLKSDFLAFYAGGLAVLRGEAARLYDADLLRSWQQAIVGDYPGTRFVYLPLYAAFYLPLAAQPLEVARAIWLILSLVMLGVALRVSQQWSGLQRREGILALLAFPATYGTLLVGQNSPLTLLLFTLVGALLWRGRSPGLIGLLAGMALYKPQLLVSLLALCVWQRRWRTLSAFSMTAGAVLVGSLLVSPATTLAFFSQGQGLLSKSVSGVVGANSSPYAELVRYVPPDTVLPIGGLLSLIIVGTLLLAWGQNRTGNPYQQAMLWLAPLLVTPYVASYDLILLALPLSFLAPVLRGDRLMQVGVALLWVGPLVNLVAGEWILLSVWGAVWVYGLCFWRARTQAEADGRRLASLPESSSRLEPSSASEQ